MSLLALMTLAGSLAAAETHDDHVAAPRAAEDRPSAVARRIPKGTQSIPGDSFSVASDDPFPDPTGTHFHSNNANEFSNPADVAEVGSFGNSPGTEEVRGMAEFPLSGGDGGTGATLMFTLDRFGGLFSQSGTDFEILVEAYAADGVEAIADYSAPRIATIGTFATGGLGDEQVLEFDVSTAIGEALTRGGDLGIRLRAATNPMAGAMVFNEFQIVKQSQRAALGGSGAVFCPGGSMMTSSKGSCTAPLGTSDRFGSSISVSGNTVMIGVPGLDDTGPDGGAAYVFLKDRGQLLFQQKITVPSQFVAAGFGKAMAIDGGVLVVGAPDEPNFLPKGTTNLRAAIYQRLATGWTFKQPVTSSVSNANSGFGQSVAMQGNMMVIGAPGRSRAAVFQFDNGFPREMGVVGPPPGGKGSGANFGRSVALSNNKFAVAGGSPVLAGTLGVFQMVGNNLSNLGAMTSNDSNENFGASLAMDGDNVFVGAPAANLVAGGAGNRTGAVLGVGLNGNQRGRFTPPNAFGGGLFGASLAARNGRLAVGQPGGGPGGKGSNPSRVYLFEATASTATQVDQVVQQTQDEAGIGNAVALGDGDLIAASPDTGALAGVLDTRGIFSDDYEATDVSLASQDIGTRCPDGYRRRQLMFIDDIESGGPGWATGGSGGTFNLSTNRAFSGVRSWRATDATGVSNQTLGTPLIQRPALVDDPDSPGFDELFVLSFKQFRDIEGTSNLCFDGGILEIQFTNFFQILGPDFITQDGYTAPVADDTGNPLATLVDTSNAENMVEEAWCGQSGNFVETQVTSFNSTATQVRYRFRYGTDNSVRREGWYIDDVIAEVCEALPGRAAGVATAAPATPGGDIPVKLR